MNDMFANSDDTIDGIVSPADEILEVPEVIEDDINVDEDDGDDEDIEDDDSELDDDDDDNDNDVDIDTDEPSNVKETE